MAFNWIKFPWTNLHDLNLDWIIQTVKTLENNLADALALVQTTVDAAITKLLTGSGDLTINKTGNVNITGNSVKLSKTVISSGSEQLNMHNPTSNTSMTANYNSGVLTLTNNQNGTAGVAVYPINTPADSTGDNSPFAANVGYVKDAVAAVDGKLDAEIENRTSGDAALQSTIDTVIMPLLTKVEKRAPCVVHVNKTATTITAEDDEKIKTALLNRTPIVLAVDDTAANNLYNYHFLNCTIVPNDDNIDLGFMIYFQTIDGIYKAHILNHGKNSLLASTIVFETA